MKLSTVLVSMALVAALLNLPGTSFSTATFTSSSSTGASLIQASPDWTPPEVSVNDPGTAVRNTVEVSASASDADSEVRTVTIERRSPHDTTWVELCTLASAPYVCSWDTTNVEDGVHRLRATATDTHGNTTTSEEVTTAVANRLTAVLSAPAHPIRGDATLATTLHDAGSAEYRVDVEFSPTGTDRWSTACADLISPFTCTWSTAGLSDGEYDLRSAAVAGSMTSHSELVREVRVDNTAPSVTMTDPGSELKGTHTFVSTAADEGSGVAEVRIQYARAGGSTWSDLCTVSADPYSCAYDTKKLSDGTYSFRAAATDRAGNTATSAVVMNRVVLNTSSTVSMSSLPSTLAGVVTLSAQASSTAGVQKVQIQHAPSGSASWTDACTFSSAPYSCSWDSRTLANGHYSFRAVLTDGNGRETVSAVVTGSHVSNQAMRGVDIAVANGGTSRRLDAGDRFSYTFNDSVNHTSVSPGWNGDALPVLVTLRTSGLLHTVEITRDGHPVNLGTVDLTGLSLTGGTATFAATMSSAATTVQGAPGTVITVRIDSQLSGNTVTRLILVSDLLFRGARWNPSGAATNLSGTPMSTAMISRDQNQF